MLSSKAYVRSGRCHLAIPYCLSSHSSATDAEQHASPARQCRSGSQIYHPLLWHASHSFLRCNVWVRISFTRQPVIRALLSGRRQHVRGVPFASSPSSSPSSGQACHRHAQACSALRGAILYVPVVTRRACGTRHELCSSLATCFVC